MALARRHPLEPLEEPLYEFQDVPHCSRRTFEENSVVVKMKDREKWIKILPELLLLCNEAAIRFEKKLEDAFDAWYKKSKLKLSRHSLNGHIITPTKPSVLGKDATDTTTVVSKFSNSKSLRNKAQAAELRPSETVNGNNEGKEEMVVSELGPAPPLPFHTGKPLSFEYIADRMDLDDPLHGYTVRDKKTGWLQGFITVTTFTTWQKWFRWDSHVDEAGLLLFEENGKGLEALHELGAGFLTEKSHSPAGHGHENTSTSGSPRKHPHPEDKSWWENRLVDSDGSLAAALNGELRDGDPDSEGVIWPRVAELSLLGAIGCGSFLVELIIEELEQSDSPYNFIVLQATENSVPFYESHGFVRVGAVARYHESNLNGDKAAKKTNEKPDPFQHLKVTASTDMSQGLKSSCYDKDAFLNGKMQHLNYNGEGEIGENNENIPTELKVHGASSHFYWHTVDTKETSGVKELAEKLGLLADDIVFLNRRTLSGIAANSRLVNGTRLRIPIFPKHVDPLREKFVDISEPIKAKDTRNMVKCEGVPGKVSSSKLYYTALENETPAKIAKKLSISASELVAVNRSTYPKLIQRASVREGTVLRLPGRRPIPQNVSKSVNEHRTRMQLDWGYVSDENLADDDISNTICYRHWAFSDDPVALTHASYMMARPLRSKKKEKKNTGERIEQLKKILVERDPRIFTYKTKDSNSSLKEEESMKGVNRVKKKHISDSLCEKRNDKTLLNSDSKAEIVEKVIKVQQRFKVNVKCISVSRSLYLYERHRHCMTLGPFHAKMKGNKYLMDSEPKNSKRRRIEMNGSNMDEESDGDSIKDVYIRNPPVPRSLVAFVDNPLKPVTYRTMDTVSPTKMKKSGQKKSGLFNKVVMLLPKKSAKDRRAFFDLVLVDDNEVRYDAIRQHKSRNPERLDENYQYYFVLTYIPDIQWARLAPMQQSGRFPKEMRGCGGKPRWVLVPQLQALEIDVSAKRCLEVRAKALSKTKDADTEEWTIG